jgi:hypothetical protein
MKNEQEKTERTDFKLLLCFLLFNSILKTLKLRELRMNSASQIAGAWTCSNSLDLLTSTVTKVMLKHSNFRV